MRIILLGAPGSGKRTQTKLLAERYGIPPVSTGELIKSAVTERTTLGLEVKAAMEAEHSVSEELVLELIRERLLQPDARDGFLLDGFPRNILQAITLDELLYELEQPIELALMIDIETDALMERLVGRYTCKSCVTLYNIYSNPSAVEGVCDQCGGQLSHRADDNEETISSRLHVYDHLVAPLIKYYGKQHKLMPVDGSGEIEVVFERICQVVDNYEPPADIPVLPDSETSAQPQTMVAEGEETASEETRGEPTTSAKKAAVKKRLAKKQTVKRPAGGKQAQVKKKANAKKPVKVKQKAVGKAAGNEKKLQSVKKKRVAKKQLVAAKAAGKKKVKQTQAKKVVPAERPNSKKRPPSKRPVATVKKSASKKQALSKKKLASKKTTAKKQTAKKKSARKRS